MSNYKRYYRGKYVNDEYFKVGGFILDYIEIDFDARIIYYRMHNDKEFIEDKLPSEKYSDIIDNICDYIERGTFIEDKEERSLSPYDFL